jgi:hypothetical protein
VTPRQPPPEPSLFDEIVFAPDRERIPGALPVVSWDPEDEPAYLAAVEAVATRRIELRRRGHDHGAWAELDLSASGLDPRRRPLASAEAEARWGADRPLLLPGLASGVAAEAGEPGLALGARLADAGELAAWLGECAGQLPEGHAPGPTLEDTDERTLSKVAVQGPGSHDLWLKSGRLSTAEGDRSLRLRVSAGREVDDDASRDEEAHRAVAGLAEALLPGARHLALLPGLAARLEPLLGAPPLLTQHIAYWNAPDGGALLHHDGFDEPENGGQAAVVYTQLSGTTAWLALSLADLADRVGEFCEHLEEGGADWLRRELFPDRRDLDRWLARVRSRAAFERELAEPGQGRFGPLTAHPEFTAFLADCGHALLVDAGDTLVLPSHGLTRCAMHSVWCASDGPTYALSAALRREAP